MTKELIYHYSMRKLSIGAVSVIVGSFFLTLGHPVHADTINNANVVQIQSNNNKSTESKAFDTKQLVTNQTETVSSKKLAVNKIQLHNQLVTKTKLHKNATLLPQTSGNKGTVIGIIGALLILLALISFKKPKENKKD